MGFSVIDSNPIIEKFFLNLENMSCKEINKEDFKLEITKIRFNKKDSEHIIKFFIDIGVIEKQGNKIIIK